MSEELKKYHNNVFKNADCLERFANANDFWNECPYSNRLYFGKGGLDYITRGHIQAAVTDINTRKPTVSNSAALEALERVYQHGLHCQPGQELWRCMIWRSENKLYGTGKTRAEAIRAALGEGE